MIIEGDSDILSTDLDPSIFSKDDAVGMEGKISIVAKWTSAPEKRE